MFKKLVFVYLNNADNPVLNPVTIQFFYRGISMKVIT